MKLLIALGIMVGIIAGGIIAIVATTTNSTPAQAGEDGLPWWVSHFQHNGHDCYRYAGYGISCVNPVEGGQ